MDKDGGPAFPVLIDDLTVIDIVQTGMSLRDYFAGQALAGLITTIKTDEGAGLLVSAAYSIADDMLVEREG